MYVGQNPLKSNVLRVLFVVPSCDWKPILPKVILNLNQSLRQLNAVLTPLPHQSILSNELGAFH
jgi:hypothetical protein